MVQPMGLYAVRSWAMSLREFGRDRQRCCSRALRAQSVWSPRAVCSGEIGSGRGKNSQKSAIGLIKINLFSSSVENRVTVGVNFTSRGDYLRALRFRAGGGTNTMRATLPDLRQAACPLEACPTTERRTNLT